MKEMRRKERQLSAAEAEQILTKVEYGVLSTVDPEGQPYGVPVNFIYRNSSIYFHCATSGHKLDNLAANPKVSFCVVGDTQVLPEKFATKYESAIVFGTASEVKGQERHDALVWLLEKYCQGFIEEGKEYISKQANKTKVIRISVDAISAKARRKA